MTGKHRKPEREKRKLDGGAPQKADRRAVERENREADPKWTKESVKEHEERND